jgi:hypothetical protein
MSSKADLRMTARGIRSSGFWFFCELFILLRQAIKLCFLRSEFMYYDIWLEKYTASPAGR